MVTTLAMIPTMTTTTMTTTTSFTLINFCLGGWAGSIDHWLRRFFPPHRNDTSYGRSYWSKTTPCIFPCLAKTCCCLLLRVCLRACVCVCARVSVTVCEREYACECVCVWGCRRERKREGMDILLNEKCRVLVSEWIKTKANSLRNYVEAKATRLAQKELAKVTSRQKLQSEMIWCQLNEPIQSKLCDQSDEVSFKSFFKSWSFVSRFSIRSWFSLKHC